MQVNDAQTDVSSHSLTKLQKKSPGSAHRRNSGEKTNNQQQSSLSDRLSAPLVSTGALMPTFMSFITVILYFVHPQFLPDIDPQWDAILYGLLSLLIIWPLTALCFCYFATARGVNPHSYGLLKSRFAVLEAKIEAFEPIDGQVQADQTGLPDSVLGKILALEQAKALKDLLENRFLNSEKGIKWVTGHGYINAWHLLHSAEEVLITIEPLAQVLADAMHDQINLQNSTLKNRSQLLKVLSRAVKELSPNMSAYLESQQIENTDDTPDAKNGEICKEGPESTPINEKTEERARYMLRHVRRQLNKFRDINWQGIMRQRIHLTGTIFLTGIVTYLLLCTSIVAISHTTHMPNATLVAATAFYFIGALAGLFDRLYKESKARTDITSVDDYGLSIARLIAVPLLAGLAAIGGVVITETLIALVKNNPIIWQNIFSVDNAQNLLTAAVFGLTPNLLIRNLQHNAEKFASDLRKTHVVGPE